MLDAKLRKIDADERVAADFEKLGPAPLAGGYLEDAPFQKGEASRIN